jgi:hypothetical protein
MPARRGTGDKPKLQARIVDLHGETMLSVDKVLLKGGDLAMKGNIMGTMPGTFYFKPEQIWTLFRMMDRKTILAVPRLLLKGRKEFRRAGADRE